MHLAEFPRFDDEYVGRQAQREQLSDWLREAALVTIVGPGGAGKTRLATEVGAQFEHALFVALAGASSEADVVRLSARAVGLGGDATWDTVVESLCERGGVAVFDNVEQVIEPFAELVAAFQGRLPLLVTSREPLRLRGERVVRLDGLSAEDARRLFQSRTAAAGLATDGDVAALVQAVEHLPLAIEIAAGRMGAMSIDEFVRRFESTLSVAAHRRRDVDARHRTLESAIRWSWDILTEDRKHALAALSLFEAPFTAEAASDVLQSAIEDALADLVDQSLLRFDRGTQRYTMFVAVRKFVREVTKGAPNALQRMVEHYRDNGARDLENARGALAAAREAKFAPELLLGLAVVVAAEMMSQSEARGALLLLNDYDAPDAPAHLQAARFATMTHALQHQHRHEDAVEIGWSAVASADETDDAALRARSRFNLAGSLGRLQRTDEALAVLADAERIALEGDCKSEAEAAAGNRGLVLLSAGRLDEAETEFTKVLEASRKAELYTHEALTLLHLGVILRDRGGKLREVLEVFEQARSAAALAQNARAKEIIDRFTVYVLAESGRRDEARVNAERMLKQKRTLGDDPKFRAIQMDLAHLERGAAGIAHAEAALAGTREPLFRVQILLFLAAEYVATGAYELARARAREGIALTEANDVAAFFRGYRAAALAFEGDAPSAREELALVEGALTGLPDVEDLVPFYRAIVDAASSGTTPPDFGDLSARFAAFHRVHLRYGRPNVVEPLLRAFGEVERAGPVLKLSRDGKHVQFGATTHDFSRRTTLRRLLLFLAETAAEVSTEDLIEAGWPGEAMTYQSGLDRVYSAIRTLRKLGLDDVVETVEGGYRIAAKTTIEWL